MSVSRKPCGEFVLTHYPPGHSMPAHTHEFSKVSLILSGRVVEIYNDRQFVGGPGQIVVKPASAPHADAVGPEGLTILSFQPAQEDLSSSEIWQCAFARYRWVPLSPVVSKLTCAWIRGAVHSAQFTEEVLSEIVAQQSTPGSSTASREWCRAVRSKLSDRLDHPPSLPALAAELEMHPVALAKALRRRFGMSKTEIVQQQRIMACLQRLRGRQSLGEIAHDLGFSDHAHLCRVFRRWIGCSPSQYSAAFLSPG